MIPLTLVALALAVHHHPSGADASPSLTRRESHTAPTVSGRGEAARETPDHVARRYRLAGELLVARGGRVLLDRGYGTVAPSGGARHRAGERWRLASITKQVTAALVVARARGRLDVPEEFADLLDVKQVPEGPAATAILSLRQLLTHHSGLADPDETAKTADGVPSFYRRNFVYQPRGPDLGYCLSRPATPGAPFHYNNCDYALLGAWLARRGAPRSIEWPAGFEMASNEEVGVPGFVRGAPEPRFALSAWGAAGGLVATARAVFDFDRSLMTARFLSAPLRDELWKPEGNGSYQALGQWVFPGNLKGCAAPKRIVQRDGEIWGVQARNYILPDDGVAVIVFTNRSADDFAIGEVWEGKGFAYDLLSAAVAC